MSMLAKKYGEVLKENEKLKQVITDMQKLIVLKDKVITNYELITKAVVQSHDAGKFKSEVLPTLRIIAK